MGIAKSLQKAGYLSLGAEGLGKFLRSLKEQQQEEELAKISNETYQGLKNVYAPEPTWTQDNSQQLPGVSLLKPQQGEPPLPPINIDSPEYQILPDLYDKEKAQTETNKLYSDYLNKITSIKGIDPDKVKRSLELLKLKGELLKPIEKEKVKKDIKEIDPKKKVIRVDDYGNVEVIQEGKPDTKMTSVTSYVSADGYKVAVMQDDEGNLHEIKSKEKVRSDSPNIKIEMPKPEKWKEFGKAMNMILYKQDENGNLIPRTDPKEKSQAQQIALNYAKSNLLPEALAWHNNEIVGKWSREDLTSYDYLKEIKGSLERGEISPEAAQDLVDFNTYRSNILGIDEKTEPVFKPKNNTNKPQTK